MSSWEDISREIDVECNNLHSLEGVDAVRRKKIKDLFDITQRPVLLYGVEMFNLQKINATLGDIIINLTDKDGFLEALKDISGDSIDVILHSPGGSPEATESLVKMLRSRFNSIRFIIPSVAKSAATMMAMSGDEIVLGKDAELGPTDPQMVINGVNNPAHAILKQFELAKQEISKNNDILPAWLPILQQYGPSLLTVCKDAISLSTLLVKNWLSKYMFSGQNSPKRKAGRVSKFLSGDKHLSHSRTIDIDELKRMGVNIKFTNECMPDITEQVQNINYALSQTFQRTGAYKIYENHLGKGFYKIIQVIIPQNQPQTQPT